MASAAAAAVTTVVIICLMCLIGVRLQGVSSTSSDDDSTACHRDLVPALLPGGVAR